MFDSLTRGTLAGGVGGVAYGLYTGLVIAPFTTHLERLLVLTESGTHPAALSDSVVLAVSVGGGVLWGVLLGACFGVAHYLFEPALPGGSRRPFLLAGIGFVTVSAGPWTILPPVTPGTEPLYGMGVRVPAYVVAMLASALAAATGIYAHDRLREARGAVAGVLGGVAPFVALATVAAIVPPMTGPLAGPPALAAAFRWLVVFGQAGLWAAIAASYRALGATPRSRRELKTATTAVEGAD